MRFGRNVVYKVWVYIYSCQRGNLPFACRSYIWGGLYFAFFVFFVFGMGDCLWLGILLRCIEFYFSDKSNTKYIYI